MIVWRLLVSQLIELLTDVKRQFWFRCWW